MGFIVLKIKLNTVQSENRRLLFSTRLKTSMLGLDLPRPLPARLRTWILPYMHEVFWIVLCVWIQVWKNYFFIFFLLVDLQQLIYFNCSYSAIQIVVNLVKYFIKDYLYLSLNLGGSKKFVFLNAILYIFYSICRKNYEK